MEPETIRAIELVVNLTKIMDCARKDDLPDGEIYIDAYVKIEKRDGRVTITGQPIKFPFIYKDNAE